MVKNNTIKRKASDKVDYVWGVLRLSLGAIFLWAFFDKLFGLGFATCRDAMTDKVDVMCDAAWLNGGSPTSGFLEFGTKGQFAETYQSLAGNAFIDWLFMLGLLGIGFALVFGIGVRIAAVAGSLLLAMMYTAVIWPEHHPVLDDHVIYIVVLVGIYMVNKNQKLGFGQTWQKTKLVKKCPWLE